MKKIENRGNLPPHLQAFAKEIGGALSGAPQTEFYEISSLQEFEREASETGYEIVPTVDTSTGRGFLVGFDVTEPKRIATLVDYSTLKIYFKECTDQEIKDWIAKMKEHRDMQQAEMFRRRAEAQAKMKTSKPLTTK